MILTYRLLNGDEGINHEIYLSLEASHYHLKGDHSKHIVKPIRWNLELVQRKESLPAKSSENIPSDVHHLHAGAQVHEGLPVNHPQAIVGDVNLPERCQGWKLVRSQLRDLIAAQHDGSKTIQPAK